jgi:hypothetical protein
MIKIDFDCIYVYVYKSSQRSKSITGPMVAEVIFFTIMIVVFVGYVITMRVINTRHQVK